MSANAQITGTYKISNGSPKWYIQQIKFKDDGTADILKAIKIMKMEGSVRRIESTTKEVRLSYKVFIDGTLDDHIARLKGDENLKDTESTKKLIKYREAGYNTLAAFFLKSETGGPDQLVRLVGKGDEFVDLDYGVIFKKAGWFW